MAGSINKVILIGNLGKDPEGRTFQNGGKMVSMSVATSEQWTDKQSGERKEAVQWHPIAIFNEALAEVAERYLKKGAKVYIEGQLETRSWNKDGQTHYATEVVLPRFNGTLVMLDRKDDVAPDRPIEQPAKPRAPRREPK